MKLLAGGPAPTGVRGGSAGRAACSCVKDEAFRLWQRVGDLALAALHISLDRGGACGIVFTPRGGRRKASSCPAPRKSGQGRIGSSQREPAGRVGKEDSWPFSSGDGRGHAFPSGLGKVPFPAGTAKGVKGCFMGLYGAVLEAKGSR